MDPSAGGSDRAWRTRAHHTAPAPASGSATLLDALSTLDSVAQMNAAVLKSIPFRSALSAASRCTRVSSHRFTGRGELVLLDSIRLRKRSYTNAPAPDRAARASRKPGRVSKKTDPSKTATARERLDLPRLLRHELVHGLVRHEAFTDDRIDALAGQYAVEARTVHAFKITFERWLSRTANPSGPRALAMDANRTKMASLRTGQPTSPETVSMLSSKHGIPEDSVIRAFHAAHNRFLRAFGRDVSHPWRLPDIREKLVASMKQNDWHVPSEEELRLICRGFEKIVNATQLSVWARSIRKNYSLGKPKMTGPVHHPVELKEAMIATMRSSGWQIPSDDAFNALLAAYPNRITRLQLLELAVSLRRFSPIHERRGGRAYSSQAAAKGPARTTQYGGMSPAAGNAGGEGKTWNDLRVDMRNYLEANDWTAGRSAIEARFIDFPFSANQIYNLARRCQLQRPLEARKGTYYKYPELREEILRMCQPGPPFRSRPTKAEITGLWPKWKDVLTEVELQTYFEGIWRGLSLQRKGEGGGKAVDGASAASPE